MKMNSAATLRSFCTFCLGLVGFVEGALASSSFKAEDVLWLRWNYGRKSVQLKKVGDQWIKTAGDLPFSGKVDSWGVQRRLQILSHVTSAVTAQPQNQNESASHVQNPKGEFEVGLANQKLHGAFDEKSIAWDDKAKGSVDLTSSPEIAAVFSEGLWGFFPHILHLCEAKSVKKVVFDKWTLQRKVKQWKVLEGEKESPARADLITEFLKKICQIDIDLFLPEEEKKDDHLLVTISEKATNSIPQKSTIVLTRANDIFFVTNHPPFKSNTLVELLKSLSPPQFKDSTSDEGRVATDKGQPQAARLAAIRKLRGNTSEEAFRALRYLIFETTDIDLYRYEAVDTLAATGTKQAYQILIERLTQVGRTGFQLRLARAVAGAMKGFFHSDEKTPDSIRLKEVDDLLEAARKNPPGK